MAARALQEHEKACIRKNQVEDREWCATFDRVIGPFQAKYDQCQADVMAMAEHGMKVYQKSFQKLIDEFGYHPAFKRWFGAQSFPAARRAVGKCAHCSAPCAHLSVSIWCLWRVCGRRVLKSGQNNHVHLAFACGICGGCACSGVACACASACLCLGR